MPRPRFGCTDDAVRALPAHLVESAGRSASHPARHLEQQGRCAVGLEVHHQHQHRNELLAGAHRQSRGDAAAPLLDARGPQHDGGRDSPDHVRLRRLGGAPQHRPMAHSRTGGRHALGHVPHGRSMARHTPLAALPLHRRQGVPGPLLSRAERCGRLPRRLHADVPRGGRGEAGGRLADDRAHRLARAWSDGQRHQRHRRLHHGQPDCLRHPFRRHPRSPNPRQGRPPALHPPRQTLPAPAHADRSARTVAGMAHRCRRPHRPAPAHLAPLRALPLQPNLALQPSGPLRSGCQHLASARRHGHGLEPGMEDELLGADARRQPCLPHHPQHAAPAARRLQDTRVPLGTHLPQPLRRTSSLPNRRQLRRVGRHHGDAAAEPRRSRPPAARLARRVAERTGEGT